MGCSRQATASGRVAGNVAQTIFDGGTLLHRKRAAEAAFDQAAAQYRSTVITAFQNVADTLRALTIDADALKAAVRAERAAVESLDIARRRVATRRESSYLALLTAQQTYQQARIALVQAQASRLCRHRGAVPGAGRRLVEPRRRRRDQQWRRSRESALTTISRGCLR